MNAGGWNSFSPNLASIGASLSMNRSRAVATIVAALAAGNLYVASGQVPGSGTGLRYGLPDKPALNYIGKCLGQAHPRPVELYSRGGWFVTPLLLTKLSRSQRKQNVNAALELVGLSDRAKHKPAELSGGQQQRVAIARALIADPTLLVCDEPTGDLDRQSAEEILGLLEILNRKQGKTIIMVTHDPLAAAHALRRLHVDKGRLDEADTRAVA